MENFNKYWREYVVGALFLANISVWSVTYAHKETGILSVYFLDVGQGDAILIDSPTRGRVLIDGGPDRKVLSELGRSTPFGDKDIDVVIATHPDADHITGLVDVLRRYEVGVLIEAGVRSGNDRDEALDSAAGDTHRLLAKRGMNIDLGGGAELIILFPERDVSGWETNDASIVAKLIYGERSFLLTGDSGKKTEYILLGLNEEILDVDVMQVGHHGSETSTSILYVQAASPEFAVISAGKDNRYGHPHKAVLDILGNAGAKIVSTAELGTIKFETDGENLVLK